ncbi:MAG: SAM-dependent methyltransferase [Ruminococcaceae bacterium]|nr:SAM-dependent methyltransferase [Oscillospiraceae bacterium]
MSFAENCLICGAPLEYLAHDEVMTCALCGKQEPSKTRCTAGHYVCNDCHTQGMDAMTALCLAYEGRDPMPLLLQLMDQPWCHMHGPEHHVMVGAALLTAYRNAGGDLDLPAALTEMLRRGRQVPGGACGFWGACGAGVSAGMFVSIATAATPLSAESWGLANTMTSRALGAIGAVGGPRCCKRDSFLAVQAAAEFCREKLGVAMDCSTPTCPHSRRNAQCLEANCPFHP